MGQKFQDILDQLPQFKRCAEEVRETLLGNLVLIGEIPAPTFGEAERVHFLQNRFAECGLHNCSTDERGNALGVLPGQSGEESILIVAHADTLFSDQRDHTITVQTDKVIGPGVADNSLGLAVLATLPTLFDRVGIRLQSDVILMGATRSLGRGDLEGLRFFLANNKLPIRAGVCIEGVQLGRLSIGSIGMLRGEIVCSVPDEYDWTRFGAAGAIQTINEVINRINAIQLPRRPRATIMLGSIEGGTSFNTIATRTALRFEIRGEDADIVEEVRQQIADIVEEMATKTESSITFEVYARRHPAGLPFAHPLSRRTRKIMKTLGVEHRTSPSTSELSEFLDREIPAVTIGMTTGERLATEEEVIDMAPISTGVAQLMGMILAIDGGFCDGRK